MPPAWRPSALLTLLVAGSRALLAVGLALARPARRCRGRCAGAGDGPPPGRSVAAVCPLAGFELFGAVGALVAYVLGQAVAGVAAVPLGEREGTPDSL